MAEGFTRRISYVDMVVVRVETVLPAEPPACFDLARSQKAHVSSAADTAERIVQGPPNDLLELGDEVTFSARHFGIRWKMTAQIVEFEKPRFFADEMVRGPFRLFRHEHTFTAAGNETRMLDVVSFSLRIDVAGIGAKLVARHLRKFLQSRGLELRRRLVTQKAFREMSDIPSGA